MKLKSKIIAILSVLIIILVGLFSYYYKDNLYEFYDNLLYEKNLNLTKNKYYKDKDYLYVKNTNDFYAKDYNHLKNIIYTILNSGTDKFTFYCDKSYKTCLYDIKNIANDKITLSNINNYVNPFNSFEKIYITYTDKGKITIEVTKNYTESEIDELNKKIDEIITNNIKEDMDDKTKIRTIHDYIINNSNYATGEDKENTYNKAVGNLLKGYGLCSGYADSMALFLDRFNIDNYKIASENHVWNLVKLNDTWYHLDLTWDDPISNDGKDHLEILFFMITDYRLKELNVDLHDYDSNVYLELKNDK